MTPKEKANKLCAKYYSRIMHTLSEEYSPHEMFIVKQCALIAINEMMEVYASACVAMGMSKEDAEKQESKYLQEVKQEIENL